MNYYYIVNEVRNACGQQNIRCKLNIVCYLLFVSSGYFNTSINFAHLQGMQLSVTQKNVLERS